MKALVLHKPNVFSIEEIPIPGIGEGEILLKVDSCAVCGTDSRILEGKKTKGIHYPSTIGHEFSGTIVETLNSDTSYRVGDRVGVAPVIPCFRCHSCMTGNENACINRTAMGYEFEGGFAEYVKIPETLISAGNLFHIPDHLSFQQAALAEPLACCINGQKKAAVGFGKTVLILGAGPIGLMHVQLASAAGASLIIVNEPNDYRRSKAAEFGAHYAVALDEEELKKLVMEMTDGIGVDCAIMAIGIPALVNPTLKLISKGGTFNLFAGFTGTGESTIEANIIHYQEITVNGTSAYTRRDYKTALQALSSGSIDISGLITHEFALEDFTAAYDVVTSGTGLKVVIRPAG